MSEEKPKTEEPRIFLGEITLTFQANGPGILVDEDLLVKMAKGAVGSLVEADLNRCVIKSIRTTHLGMRPMVTDNALAAFVGENAELIMNGGKTEAVESAPKEDKPNGVHKKKPKRP